MNRGEIALLGARARAQIEKELKTAPLPTRRAQSQRTAPSTVLLQCAHCDFPPTSNMTAMERHCDAAGHHRYRVIL